MIEERISSQPIAGHASAVNVLESLATTVAPAGVVMIRGQERQTAAVAATMMPARVGHAVLPIGAGDAARSVDVPSTTKAECHP